jgi:phospholipid/cholesterol/gamma-HCH transport system substrate-binding protein
VALIAGAAWYAFGRPEPEMYTVTADVIQAPNLFTGSRVMVRGVEVGKVTDVTPGPESVGLEMEIQDGVQIPADATLSIVPITVISDRYVQFFPAYKGGPTLADGDHIPMDRTSIPAELDDVLEQLKGLLAALEPRPGEDRGPLARLIGDLDEALKGRSKHLSEGLKSSASVLENLADSEADIAGLIQNLDTAFIALANRSSEIGLVNERLELVTEALLTDQENLEGTIENVTDFSEQFTSLIRESGDDLGRSFGSIGRVVKIVLAHEKELLTLTRWTNVIAQGLGETDSSGKGLYAYSGRQAPPGTAGAEYNYRIDTRDTIACERINALIESFLVLNPTATLEQLRDTLMAFFPETYKDDLEYLVDLLIPLCADYVAPTSALGPRVKEAIKVLEDELGTKRVAALLMEWYLGREGR